MENQSNYNMYGSLDNKTSEASYYYSTVPSDNGHNQFYTNYSSYYDPSQYQQYGFLTSQNDQYQQMPVNSNYYFYPPAYSSYHYSSMPKVVSEESNTSSDNRNSTSPSLPTQQTDFNKTTTPEKQINDSGIEISPQLSFNSFNSSNASTNQTPSYSKTVSSQEESDMSDDEDDNDDEEENKENAQVQASKSSSGANMGKPPKPYLEIIADAILSAQVKAMQLHEIYNYMENKFPYFARNINKSWRNSVRHNLSLNECFVKAGRGSNGKGNYWRIHPLCEKEFIRGNFRRKSFKKLIKAGTMNAQNNQNTHSYYSNTSSAYQFIPPVMPTNNNPSATFQYPFRAF